MTINIPKDTEPVGPGFDHINQIRFSIMKKIIDNFAIKELDPSLKTHYALGVMRHGKTIKLDNEGNFTPIPNHILNQDPPKSSTIGLHTTEFNEVTSQIYQTVLQIKALGYYTIRLYCPQDSKRNQQTVQLIQLYGEQLGLQIIIDRGFNQTGGFSARSKIDRNLVKQLFDEGYIDELTLSAILSDINKEKHILGETKYLKNYLQHKQLMSLKKCDEQLYSQIMGQCEQSYTEIIAKVGTSLDYLTDYIQKHNLSYEYHLIVGYRTTIQAMDKKFTEINPGSIDLNYTCKFAEMHLTTLNSEGNIFKQHKELWMPNPITYTSDINQLSQLDPNINLQNTVIENQNIINTYLHGITSHIQEHLQKNRINLLLAYCKIGGIVRDLIIKNSLLLLITNINLKSAINSLIHHQIEINNYSDYTQTIQLFNILYQYRNFGNRWIKLFDKMSPATRIRLDTNLSNDDLQQIIRLYSQKESYFTGSNKHLLQIKSIGGGEMINLDDVYVEQQFENSGGSRSMTQIADQLITHPGFYQIHGTGGEGKSTTLKAIAKHLLITQTPPPLITWITPSTDIDKLSKSDFNQVWIIDSIDELGSGGDIFIKKVQSIIKPQQYISCIGGSRINALNISSDYIFNTTITTEVQKNKYISSYLNQIFGSDSGKPRQLMEQTITKLGNYIINPLIISMIAQIMEDDNLSIELENIQTKSDLYKILVKVLRKKGKEGLTKEQKQQYFNNQYRGDNFNNERIQFLGNCYIINSNFSGSNNDKGFFTYHKERDKTNVGPEIYKSSFLFDIAEEFPEQMEMINTLIPSGLLQVKPDGSVYCIHKSILEYAGYQYINKHTNTEKVFFFDRLVSNILIDTYKIIEYIYEDYSDYITSLYTENIISMSEYYNKDYKNNPNVLNIDQFIKEHSMYRGTFTCDKIIDIFYFEGKKTGDDLIILLLENLPQIIKKEKINTTGHRLIILSLIQGIKNNKDNDSKAIIDILEKYIETNKIQNFI